MTRLFHGIIKYTKGCTKNANADTKSTKRARGSVIVPFVICISIKLFTIDVKYVILILYKRQVSVNVWISGTVLLTSVATVFTISLLTVVKVTVF